MKFIKVKFVNVIVIIFFLVWNLIIFFVKVNVFCGGNWFLVGGIFYMGCFNVGCNLKLVLLFLLGFDWCLGFWDCVLFCFLDVDLFLFCYLWKFVRG